MSEIDALDEMEKWIIVEHLIESYYSQEGTEDAERIASVLDKLSPNWRDADSCRAVEYHEVIVNPYQEVDGDPRDRMADDWDGDTALFDEYTVTEAVVGADDREGVMVNLGIHGAQEVARQVREKDKGDT